MRPWTLLCLGAAAACSSPPYVPPPPSAEQVYDAATVDEWAEIVLTPPLQYPDDPRLADVEGVVLVRVVIDTAGNPEPTTTRVLATPDSALGVAGQALVRKTLFRPARVRGRVVQVTVDLAVTFSHAMSPPVSVHFLDDVYRASEVPEKPRITFTPRLTYPGPLLLAGVQGRVVVQAVIDTTGRVEERTIAVVESGDPRFNDAAKAYLRAARFSPGRIAGRAVRVRFQLPVEFRLPGRD